MPLKKIPHKKSESAKEKKPSVSKVLSKKLGELKRKIKKSAAALVKPPTNPIIEPIRENGWEAWQTFNPGAILLKGNIHFLYRAIGADGISRIGYAFSNDGFKVGERFPHPVFEHRIKARTFNIYSYFAGGSWGGAEDPRIVRVGDEDVLYMTYTACGNGLRIGLTSIGVNDFLNKRWEKWATPFFLSPPDKVNKNWVIFPEKIKGRYGILHSISPEVSIAYLDNLDFSHQTYIESHYSNEPRKNCWDKWVRGVGPVPIKTKYGWLIFYHAMDNDWSKYKVGTMLLDLDDPTKVLCRSKEPVLEPSEHYENNGFKSGVVYASGAVVKNGELLVYYGGADSCVCVASANLDKFLDALRKNIKPTLYRGIIKKKR